MSREYRLEISERQIGEQDIRFGMVNGETINMWLPHDKM